MRSKGIYALFLHGCRASCGDSPAAYKRSALDALNPLPSNPLLGCPARAMAT